ncbi:MAG TPA: hypothetical protein PKC30_04105 [Saprospiraceae bacterium]|nr:hypothetical protein [Saprospiraceae bacterium]
MIILEGSCNENSQVLNFAGIVNGKNSYSATLVDPPGGVASLFWSVINNRWELTIEGSSFDPLNGLNYFNTLNSCVEPPCSGWTFGASDEHPCFDGFMDLQLDGTGNGLAPECEEDECPPAPIPTLYQWGFITLLLSFMIIAIVKIRNRKHVLDLRKI